MPEDIELQSREMAGHEDREDIESARRESDVIARRYAAEQPEYYRELSDKAVADSRRIELDAFEEENVQVLTIHDSEYNSDLRDRDSRSGRDLERNAENVHQEIGRTPARGRLYTRWKFWSIVIPTAVSLVTTTVAVIVTYYLTKEDNHPSELSSNTELPQSTQDLLKAKAQEWSTMPIADAFAKMAELVKTYNLSLQAQAFILNDLKLLTQTSPPPEAWGTDEQKNLVDTLLNAYSLAKSNQAPTPPSLALYNTVPTLTRGNPPKPLTVYEGADICDLAVCQIFTLSKASAGSNP